MKVLIADNHYVVRKGLIQIVSIEYPEVVFDEAANGRDAYKKLMESNYHLAILDITMPEMSGLDVVRELRKEGCKTPLFVLTAQPEAQYALRVLRAGASGFLEKSASGGELIVAINRILSGKKFITESVAELLANDLLEDHSKIQHEQLSDREFEVLKLISSGKKVSEIAEKLCLSVPTISTYRRRLLEKMKLRNNAELMRYAMNHKLV